MAVATAPAQAIEYMVKISEFRLIVFRIKFEVFLVFILPLLSSKNAIKINIAVQAIAMPHNRLIIRFNKHL